MKKKIISLLTAGLLSISIFTVATVNADAAITVVETGDVVPDLAFNNAIRDKLNYSSGDGQTDILDTDPLTIAHMASLAGDLIIGGVGIVSIEGIQYATNITTLIVEHNQISDISPLAGLTKLTAVDLTDNQIFNITSLTGLTDLNALDLSENQISNITSVAGLGTNLTALDVSNNQISDISPVAGLTNLTDLRFAFNQISAISPVAGLTNLTLLIASGNHIIDLSPLQQPLTANPNLQYHGIDQTATLPVAINNAGTVTIANPCKVPVLSVPPVTMYIDPSADGGTYDTVANTITWAVTPNTSGNLTFKFSGTGISGQNIADVTVPYGIASAPITVKYQDEAGATIAPDTTFPAGLVGEPYTAPTPEPIAGYTFKWVKTGTSFASAPATGNYTDQPQTIVYIYSKNATPPVTSPKTGDGLPVVIVMLAGTLLAAGTVLLKKNKVKRS